MLKKIIYIMLSVTLGFVFFYFSWVSASSKAVLKKGNKALEENNIDFFLKFHSCYDDNSLFSSTYDVDKNTTKVDTYYTYSKSDDISSILFVITKINTDNVYIDEVSASSSSWDKEDTTIVTLTADNGATWNLPTSTYGYDDMPIIMLTFDMDSINTELKKGNTDPTKITSITLTDSKEYVFGTFTFNIDLIDYKIEEWNAMVEAQTAKIGYTSSEYRKEFNFSYPEMWSVWIITGIVLIAMAGLGVFIFWPKKDYSFVSNKKKEDRTFAPTVEKKVSTIEAIAKSKKEKEERENRYKNVRSVNTNEDVVEGEIVEDTDETVDTTNDSSEETKE